MSNPENRPAAGPPEQDVVARLPLTPEQSEAGGTFRVCARFNGEKTYLEVEVPPNLPEGEVLRVRGIPFGELQRDVFISPVVRRLLPMWPPALIGSIVLMWAWHYDRARGGLVGGLVLLGMAAYGRKTGRLPLAGGASPLRDVVFLTWLIICSLAAAVYLSTL